MSVRSGCGSESGGDQRGDACGISLFGACDNAGDTEVLMGEFRRTGEQAGAEAAAAEPRSEPAADLAAILVGPDRSGQPTIRLINRGKKPFPWPG